MRMKVWLASVVSVIFVTAGLAGVADADGGDASGVTPQTAGSTSPKPAVVRHSIWYLRDTPTSGVADHVFQYGDPGDVPFFGDWDGNGTTTPGVFRNGTWYLRNSNTTGVADMVLSFGDPGDKPIVGDWNGDGIDTPGVVRSGVWYLRNSLDSGTADITFVYGDPGDMPITGDWNGDGVDTPAVGRTYFKVGEDWEYRNSNTTGTAESNLSCRWENPVPGAWEGAQQDMCGWFDARTGQWIVRTDENRAATTFTFGDPGDVALRWS